MHMMNHHPLANTMSRTLTRLPSLRIAEWCKSASWGRLLDSAAPLRQPAAAVGWTGRSFCVAAAALEEVSDAPGKKAARRLSREERAALVESFVQKHRDAHHGEFPSTSLVIKEVGGGRQVIKDILSDLHKQLGSHILNDDRGDSDLEGAGPSLSAHINGARQDDEGEAELTGDSVLEERVVEVESRTRDSHGSLAERGSEEKGKDVAEETMCNEQGDVPALAFSATENTPRTLSQKGEALESPLPGDSSDGDSLTRGSAQKVILKEAEQVDDVDDMSEDEDEFDVADEDVSAVNGTKQPGMGRGEIGNQSSLNWERLRAIGSNRRQEPQAGDLKVGRAASKAPPVRMTFFDGENEDDEFDEYPPVKSVGKSAANGGVLSQKEKVDKASDTTNGLFIRYLPPSASVHDIKEAFEKFGEIVRVNSVPPKRPDSKFTFGFVNFKTEEAYHRALRHDPIFVRGSRVRIEPQQRENRVKGDSLIAGDSQLSNSAVDESTVAKAVKPVSQARNPGYAVAIENLPGGLSVIQLKESLSAYGEIVDTYSRRGPAGVMCFVEYKTEDARENALASRVLDFPGGQSCRIHRVDDLVSPVVRLSHLSSETTEDMVASLCRKFGQVERVVTRKEGIVDVYFQEAELKHLPKILASLNAVTLHQRRWRARPAPRLPALGAANLIRSPAGQEWIRNHQLRTLTNIDEALKKIAVDVEDARELLSLSDVPYLRPKDGNANLFRKFSES